MSMNLTLHFEDSKGGLVREVGLRQTPTKITYEILDSEDKKEAYFAWVRNTWRRSTKDYYGDAHRAELRDIFEEYTPDYKPVWGMI